MYRKVQAALRRARSVFRKPLGGPRERPLVIANIGAHKTGSSLIQTHFRSNRAHYEERGLAILTRGEASAAIGIGGVLKKDPGILKNKIERRIRLTGNRVLFFSYENILGRPFGSKVGLYVGGLKSMGAFRQAVAGCDVRIAYAIRPQWEFVQSYYIQRVHEGYFLPFEEFLREIDLDRISWVPLIEGLRTEFGEENVDVFDFGEIRKGQAEFVARLVRTSISEDLEVAPIDQNVHNASLSERGLEIALRVNPLLTPGTGEAAKVRQFLQAHFSNRSEPRPKLMSRELKDWLMKRYGEEYESLVRATPVTGATS